MAIQLYNLRGVPEDEAGEICQVLTQHEIDYYLTPAGNWGISSPGIWLRDDAQLEQARALIREYQDTRQAARDGQHKVTLLERIRENPLRFILFIAAIALVVYLSTIPFLHFGK